MEKLVHRLQQDYPEFDFTIGKALCWSPKGKQIFYTQDGQSSAVGVLHELAHAKLEHQAYVSDMDLLQKELAAWREANQLARHYEVPINTAHIEDCLDTYRDWLHKRSGCPTCASAGVQKDSKHYSCLNCRKTWQVTAARFCRPYRISSN